MLKTIFLVMAILGQTLLMGGDAAPGSVPVSYYLDSVHGDDRNDGRSAEFPWKTLSRLRHVPLAPGTQVLLKRGLVWREQLEVNSSGTAGAPIVFGAYGKGENPAVSGADVVSDWVLHGTKIYRKTFPRSTWPYLSNVAEDQKILSLVAWQGASTATEAMMPKGSFAYDKDSHTLYVRTTDDRAPAAHVLTAGRRLYCALIEKQSHLVMKDLTFEQASLHGVFISNANEVWITDCTIRYCGGMWLLNLFFAGNGIEWSRNTTNCSIRNSHIYQIFDSGMSPQLYDSNVELRNLVIENNRIENCGMDGIEISIQKGLANAFIDGVSVRGNRITGGGTGWSGTRTGNGIKIYNQQGSFHHVRNVELSGNTLFGNKGVPILIENAGNVDTPKAAGNTDEGGNEVVPTR